MAASSLTSRSPLYLLQEHSLRKSSLPARVYHASSAQQPGTPNALFLLLCRPANDPTGTGVPTKKVTPLQRLAQYTARQGLLTCPVEGHGFRLQGGRHGSARPTS
jgi:hypothetical protein